MIYTFGYSKWQVEQTLAMMTEKGISYFVDVRSIPYGRWNPAFNRNNLEKALGDRYLWKGDILGGKHGPVTDKGIDWLQEMAEHNLLLMCVESDPRKCHRLNDIGVRLHERGIDCIHLLHDGSFKMTSDYIGTF